MLIKKASPADYARAFDTMDFDFIEIIDQEAEKQLFSIFQKVASGVIRVAWFDKKPVRTASGAASVMRCALHRSTKKENCLQFSVMELKNNDIIPCYDVQCSIDFGFSDFLNETPSTMEFNFI